MLFDNCVFSIHDLARWLNAISPLCLHSAIRWYVSMYALFHRQTDVGLQKTEGGFRTQVFMATDPTDIDFATVRTELDREVERFTNVGSGWTLTAILRFVIRIG